MIGVIEKKRPSSRIGDVVGLCLSARENTPVAVQASSESIVGLGLSPGQQLQLRHRGPSLQQRIGKDKFTPQK